MRRQYIAPLRWRPVGSCREQEFHREAGTAYVHTHYSNAGRKNFVILAKQITTSAVFGNDIRTQENLTKEIIAPRTYSVLHWEYIT